MTDALTRLNAALSGRYSVERTLGEGGMATVYLANDLKHHRSVALKVLKPELAAVVGSERFLAEIRTTANLQHPHILPLFDSGEADGLLFYAMPHVEGESLRARLDSEHQLPVDEAVRIATNVAEALDYAHRQGVIHRDIKPANILLLDGKPVIADFGIALAVSHAGGGRLTETGLSLGTPHYMSPEQATGDGSVGAATDVYALGCVLYEMLVGEPPYTGSTAQAILGKIIQAKPVSATEARRSVPANVDAAIRKALEKLSADRFTSAQDFARELSDAGFRHGEVPGVLAGADPGPWKAVAAAFAVLFLLSAGVAARALLRPQPARPIATFESPFRAGEEPVLFRTDAFALSPDGSLLIYRGPARGGPWSNQLWIRRWDDPEGEPVRGTQEAIHPAVSPDGERLAFVQQGQISVVSLAGGPITALARGNRPHWGPDAFVYYHGPDRAIMRVPATGGEPEVVRAPAEADGDELLVDFLPNGDGLMMVHNNPYDGIPAGRVDLAGEFGALDLGTAAMTVLGAGQWPRLTPSGHLTFLAEDGSLVAASFDARTLELGPAVALIDSVAAYTVSETGSLVYQTGSIGSAGITEPVWVTRSGTAELIDPGWRFDSGVDLGGSYGWHLSPDGTRAAVTRVVGDNRDIWIKELPDGPFRRLTTDPEAETSPFWSPGGDVVAYSMGGPGNEVWRRRADGTGSSERLLGATGGLVVQGRWSPDGEWIVVRGVDVSGFRPGVDSVLTPLVATGFDERGPALSPDGRWFAYSSNESGREEVYVRPFPEVDGGLEQVSVTGGSNPVWARSGAELFFVDPDRGMNVARLETEPRFRVVERQVLFTLTPDLIGYSIGDGGDHFYDVAPGDERFLMGRLVTGDAAQRDARPRLILVQNWTEELERRVPTH
ncbi:MAG TPA: protein kinase [Longimicrobiales bacterium]|nr:protein kinase [Longimicrobiales bacterium]